MVSPFANRNRLLEMLSEEERTRIESSSETLDVALGEKVYENEQPIPYVYFPLSGVISVVAFAGEETKVEVATVGNEGFIGLPVFLGTGSTTGEAFCQIPSKALRMSSGAFREEVDRGAGLHVAVQRYIQALFAQIAQAAACNRAHPVEERAARWLLMTHDRVEGDEFALTQQFLAQMLGVRRAGVNAAAAMLQRAGYIYYTRGRITVLDRIGLESASCECYGIIRDQFERLLVPN